MASFLRNMATVGLLSVVHGHSTVDEDLLIERIDQMVQQRVEEAVARLNTEHEKELAALESQYKEKIESRHQKTSHERRGLSSVASDNFAGLQIENDMAAVTMGEDADVQLIRSGPETLALVAHVNVTGSLFVDGLDSSVADVLAALIETVNTPVPKELAKASLEFGAPWNYDYGTKVPFGSEDPTFHFDVPHTAKHNYGRLADGIFTAPEDGVYFMSVKTRIKDSSTSSIEIEFLVNGADTDSFEMWMPVGDASGRRSNMATYLGYLSEGDELYALSDLTTTSGFMGTVDVFQVASDRVAFSVVANGGDSSTGTPFMSMYTQASAWAVPSEYEDAYDSDTGIFTAPRDGVYFFANKYRITDSTSGDIEIEWSINDDEAPGSFEMWLHTGDPSSRRAHMSTLLAKLDEGDTVYPFTDIGNSASVKTTFSGFEIAEDVPAFNAVQSAAFEFDTSGVPFGEGSTSVDFEVGSDGAIADGVYTCPETGYYYFVTKLRPADDETQDIEIEWKIDDVDVSALNYEMWIHSGDDSDRRSGMSYCMIRCEEGQEVYATSDAALSSGDTIVSWTFSGFKLQ